MPPTLLTKGKIKKLKWFSKETEHEANNLLGVKFIMEYLLKRVNFKNFPSNIKPYGCGSHVLILRSGTGSGKSTTIPDYLYKTFFEKTKKTIIITEPTRATTESIPYDIVKYNADLKMGVNIGYQTGIAAKKPARGILFCTTGVLLQFLKLFDDETIIKKYSFILIDEVHMRETTMDMCMYYLKLFLKRNWDKVDCPFVIFMSGTFEPELFLNYFECKSDSFLDVEGLSFPITDYFTKYDLSDYISYIGDLIESIHIENISDINKTEFCDILIFLQGMGKISQIEEKIHYLNSVVFSNGLEFSIKHSRDQMIKYNTQRKTGGDVQNLYLLPVIVMSEHLNKGSTEYIKLYSDIKTLKVPIYKFIDGKKTDEILHYSSVSRRIILGTNAIETGMTIDTLGYCIDSGWVLDTIFMPNYGCLMMVEKGIPKSSALQRRGRVGRKATGSFYGCYTKETYDTFPKNKISNIIKEDITELLLSIIISETETSLEVNSNINKINNINLNSPSDGIEYYPDIINTKKHDDANLFRIEMFEQNNEFKINNLFHEKYQIKSKNEFDVSKLEFIQSISSDSLCFSLEKLYVLGFINNKYQPTIFGLYASKFTKLSMENIRLLLGGYAHGCNIPDLITIASFLQMGSFKLGIKRKKYNYCDIFDTNDTYKANCYAKYFIRDDFIEFIFIWDEFMSVTNSVYEYLRKSGKTGKNYFKLINDWCEKKRFNINNLLNIVEIRNEIMLVMRQIGLNPYYNGLNMDYRKYNLVNLLNDNFVCGYNEIKKIKKTIYEAYRLNLFILDSKTDKYVNYNYGYKLTNTDNILLKPVFIHDKKIKSKYIIVSSVSLKSDLNSSLYEFTGSDVCVLDDFVNPDLDFILH